MIYTIVAFLAAVPQVHGQTAYYLEFQKAVKSPSATPTIDAKLNFMKAQRMLSPHFENYTLMRDSQSLQPSTSRRPRSINFGHTGEFIFTFHDDPTKFGYAEIETADFNPQKKKLELREVIFKAHLPAPINAKSTFSNSDLYDHFEWQAGHASEELNDLEYEDAFILISKPNPAKCLRCHGIGSRDYDYWTSVPRELRPAKYLWSPYNFWSLGKPWGEKDDRIELKEASSYVEERQANLYSRRYSTLHYPASDPFYPYYLADLDINPKKNSKRTLWKMPNTRLTMLMGYNMIQQQMHQLKLSASDVSDVRTLLRGAYGCRNRVTTTDNDAYMAKINEYQASMRNLRKRGLERRLFNLEFDVEQERTDGFSIGVGIDEETEIIDSFIYQLPLELALNNFPLFKTDATKTAVLAEIKKLRANRVAQYPRTNDVLDFTYSGPPEFLKYIVDAGLFDWRAGSPEPKVHALICNDLAED